MGILSVLFREVLRAVESAVDGPPVRSDGSTRSEIRRDTSWFGDRHARIHDEVHMIARHFSKHEGVCWDEANADWVMIPKYPLPERWRARWCRLLIVLPQAYPATPPIGFYLNRRFRLKKGGQDNHLIGFGTEGAPDLQAQDWQWYCVRTADGPGGWRPSTDCRTGDNLWTFLTLVREALTNED